MIEKVEQLMRALESSLKEISSLVAWRDLKLAERQSDIPPSFRIYDPTEAEIKMEIGFFLKTSMNARIAAARLPVSKQPEIHRRLSLMEKEFNQLRGSEKLINH